MKGQGREREKSNTERRFNTKRSAEEKEKVAMSFLKTFPRIRLLISVSFIFVEQIHSLKSTGHEKNVAILLSSSTFFHNYRHTTNTLAIYDILKTHGGFTDDNIILFLADEVACHACNPEKRYVSSFGSGPDGWKNLYDDVEVDYSGTDVTVDNFFRVLLGRHHRYTAPNQRLDNIDENTNVFIYLTGHGGDQFFKFRDLEHFSTSDFRSVLEEMQIMKRYKSILFLADTCQAFTLAPNTREMHFESPIGTELRNVYSLGSSLKDQNSYAHHADRSIGHSTIDRYVHHLTTRMANKWEYMKALSVKSVLFDSMYIYSEESVAKFLQVKKLLGSDVGWSDFGCDIPMDEIPLSDFFLMKKGARDINEESSYLLLDRVEFGQVLREEQEIETNQDSIVENQQCNVTTAQILTNEEERTFPFLQKGMLPTDHFFLFSIATVIALTQLLSRVW